jgi:flagella basal body P-ring formation protein FlgA
MNTEPTFFRRLTSNARQWLCAISAVCLFNADSPALADAVTLPDMLIGVTQGFLEFTVEDYLASSQTEGRYEIQVNQLDPRLRMPLCDKELTATLESPATPIGRVTVKDGFRTRSSPPVSRRCHHHPTTQASRLYRTG